MLEQYAYETREFGIDSKSIEILRPPLSPKVILAGTIQSIEIKTGRELTRIKLIFAFVLIGGLLAYAIYDSMQYVGKITGEYTADDYYKIGYKPGLATLAAIVVGIAAFIKTKMILLTTAQKSYNLSLRKIVKQKKPDAFIQYLQKNFHQANIILKD